MGQLAVPRWPEALRESGASSQTVTVSLLLLLSVKHLERMNCPRDSLDRYRLRNSTILGTGEPRPKSHFKFPVVFFQWDAAFDAFLSFFF